MYSFMSLLSFTHFHSSFIDPSTPSFRHSLILFILSSTHFFTHLLLLFWYVFFIHLIIHPLILKKLLILLFICTFFIHPLIFHPVIHFLLSFSVSCFNSLICLIVLLWLFLPFSFSLFLLLYVFLPLSCFFLPFSCFFLQQLVTENLPKSQSEICHYLK